jgi:hypothetical protein
MPFESALIVFGMIPEPALPGGADYLPYRARHGSDWQRRYVDFDTSAELVCGREVDTPNDQRRGW